MTSRDIVIDLRKIVKENISFRVQYKNLIWFKLGLLFIRLGCWLTGAELVDEFPMSLYQDIKEKVK